jgi:DNA-binding response OmpR family regulator
MMQPRDVVLLVDDSPEALGFLTEALEKAGYSVLIATSGQAALNIAERIAPDIVLMDAVMPGMDGFETCRRLKESAALAQVPVLFMTGLSDTEHVVRALEAGGVDYLTKPINVDELKARMAVHLANARSTLSARMALDAAGRHLLAAGADGQILWCTPQASRLLETADDGGTKALSEAIAAWLPRHLADPGQPKALTLKNAVKLALSLNYVGSLGVNEYLFRLAGEPAIDETSALRQNFGLTQREAEVLLWVSKGKSNKDIGEILGISARTATKHLEQIYVKLGVENRASAAVKTSSFLDLKYRQA